MSQVIESIVEQHADEAAFLWMLRDHAVRAPHYDLKDLAALDERVEAHIDGLRVADTFGWTLCEQALACGQPGEAFAAGVLALESGASEKLDTVVACVDAAPTACRGLLSAFGWVHPGVLQGTVKTLLSSASSLHRRLGLVACALHRVDAGDALPAAIEDADLLLSHRASRAAGELGRVDVLNTLTTHLNANDDISRTYAAWSSVLLGDRGAGLETLRAIAQGDSPLNMTALDLSLRASTPDTARRWLKPLADAGRMREVIQAAGIVGDPLYIPWLIKHMQTPAVARVAGEAFSMITGVDIAYDDLEGEWPGEFTAGPNDDPNDDNVEMDADEDLPWPEPPLIERWWSENASRFVPGQRYLVGELITAAHCETVLRNCTQRQRRAAALELALMSPATPLFETRAPGKRQQQQLTT